MAAMPDDDRPYRSPWLVLALDGPAMELPALTTDAPVIVVSEPSEFRPMLERVRPRIAVLAMPPAGPGEIAIVAHERRRRPRLRAALLTPEVAALERLAALELGFDDALPTCIEPRELAGRLALLAQRARARPGPALAIGPDLELDLAGHELRRNGRIVHLRPKEYRLLALLAAHPGRAYTRRQLLDRVWGIDHQGGPRTVDVHVRWLRSNIETDPDRPVHLVTVRGVGYRLDPTQDDRMPLTKA